MIATSTQELLSLGKIKLPGMFLGLEKVLRRLLERFGLILISRCCHLGLVSVSSPQRLNETYQLCDTAATLIQLVVWQRLIIRSCTEHRLRPLAQCLFCAPVSSVANERLFCQASLVIEVDSKLTAQRQTVSTCFFKWNMKWKLERFRLSWLLIRVSTVDVLFWNS